MNARKKARKSPCCNARVWASLGDGVLLGSCPKCLKVVYRINPSTGDVERVK
jgi:hypothetical protein